LLPLSQHRRFQFQDAPVSGEGRQHQSPHFGIDPDSSRTVADALQTGGIADTRSGIHTRSIGDRVAFDDKLRASQAIVATSFTAGFAGSSRD
jgi:hypothetical protein